MTVRALVTGASRGIGAAIALEMAKRGYHVIINFRSRSDAAEAVAARIREGGGEATLARFDVANAVETEAAIASLLEDPTPIEVVVNNAGISHDGPFPGMERDAWESVTRTTLDGFYNVTRPLIMPMVRRKRGRIINIASVAGVIGNRGQANYSAAKAGLIGATRSLAQELAKRRITVNAIAPGLIETDMIENAPVEEIRKLIPAQRLGQPEEVAALAGFLVDDVAGYITGQVIGINGGLA